MILGDNVFYGNGLKKSLSDAILNSQNGKATIFGYHVNDPQKDLGWLSLIQIKKPSIKT